MNIRDFDYQLFEEMIALYPCDPRDSSRLMILNRTSQHIENRKFFEIIDYIKSGDALVLNNTKVIPARLYGRKISGGKIEILLLNQVSEKNTIWECLLRSSRKAKS